MISINGATYKRNPNGVMALFYDVSTGCWVESKFMTNDEVDARGRSGQHRPTEMADSWDFRTRKENLGNDYDYD